MPFPFSLNRIAELPAAAHSARQTRPAGQIAFSSPISAEAPELPTARNVPSRLARNGDCALADDHGAPQLASSFFLGAQGDWAP